MAGGERYMGSIGALGLDSFLVKSPLSGTREKVRPFIYLFILHLGQSS